MPIKKLVMTNSVMLELAELQVVVMAAVAAVTDPLLLRSCMRTPNKALRGLFSWEP